MGEWSGLGKRVHRLVPTWNSGWLKFCPHTVCVNWRAVSSKSAKAFLTECQQLEMFMSALVKGLPVLL